MGLIGWYTTVKIKAFFRWKDNRSGIIYAILGMAAMLYAVGLLYLLMTELTKRLSVEHFKHILLVTVVSMTVLRKFLPQYIPFRKSLLPYHPTSAIFRYAFNVLDEILCFNFVNTVLFISLLLIFPFFTIKDALTWIIWIVVAIICRRFIQCLLEQRIRRHDFFLLLGLSLAAIIGAVIFWQPAFINTGSWEAALIAIVVAGLADFMMEEKIGEYEYTSRQGVTSSHTGFNILMNAPVLRVAVTGAFIVKALFLLVLTMKMQKKGVNEMMFVTMLFSSPALPFTYCFNNCWGPLRNYWFSIDQADPNGTAIWRLQLRIMALPLAIDSILTIIFYIVNSKLGPMILVSYFASGILLCVLSYYWSLRFPFYVKRGFSMNVNTSTVASLITLPICTALWLTCLSPAYYLIAVAYVIAALVLIIRMNKFYNNIRISVYSKLYR
ncbi:hypothetical protein CLV59_105114 [Chitinophaga dinghuensis]|uniref:Uncharacterized protein n=1 Tax=Chitinophaga dinghuensis TaxID=1539050 RepID=A0A327VVI5_9BACT|nr:hypothetical protein [Chitinophaga dinghuensis]RAJ80007.1 hypothetical protein CLV59_105114 [Chitinophaga dinghuensis]